MLHPRRPVVAAAATMAAAATAYWWHGLAFEVYGPLAAKAKEYHRNNSNDGDGGAAGNGGGGSMNESMRHSCFLVAPTRRRWQRGGASRHRGGSGAWNCGVAWWRRPTAVRQERGLSSLPLCNTYTHSKNKAEDEALWTKIKNLIQKPQKISLLFTLVSILKSADSNGSAHFDF